MLSVFKYPIPVDDEQDILLPAGAQILHFAEQHGSFCLWALVDPDQQMEVRRIRIDGTGHPIETASEALRFISTTLMHDGNLVFHAFEIMPGAGQ